MIGVKRVVRLKKEVRKKVWNIGFVVVVVVVKGVVVVVRVVVIIVVGKRREMKWWLYGQCRCRMLMVVIVDCVVVGGVRECLISDVGRKGEKRRDVVGVSKMIVAEVVA